MPLFNPTSGVSTGSILPYGNTTAPTDYLLCNGAAVSRTTYTALFGVINTSFGAGDGSTTFNVPDMRGKFVLGQSASGTGSTFAGTGGVIDHLHSVTLPNIVTSAPSATAVAVALLGTVASSTHTHNFTAPVTNTSTSNPPFIATVYIIKI